MISNPESFQLLGDESRRKIIFFLRAKPMTATQLADELSLSTQTVYHHLQKLKNAGMVEVVREERIGHLIESIYQATAEVFGFTMGGSRPSDGFQKKLVKTVVDALNRIGFGLEYSDTTAQDIYSAEKKTAELSDLGKFAESISNLDDIDIETKQKVMLTASYLKLSDEKYDELVATNRRIRKLYLSMTKNKNDN